MRRLLIFLLLVVVVVVALGFYQGWWTFSTSKNPETGKKAGEVTIDEKKIKDDLKKAKDKIKSSVGNEEHSDGK